MTKILGTIGLCILAVACGGGASQEETGTIEDKITTTGGGTCTGWSCGQANRPVSDNEIFALIAQYENGSGPTPLPTDPSTPVEPPSGQGQGQGSSSPPPPPQSGTVRLGGIECISIPNACVRSCAIRTSCGGGGHVSAADSATLQSWLLQRGIREDGPGWARRAATGAVVCTKGPSPASAARCTIATNVPPPPTEPSEPGDPVILPKQ